MPVKLPTLEELARIAESYALRLTEEELASFQGMMGGMLASYAHIDELTEPTLPVRYPRTPGYRPQPEANPLGAWYWRTEITGASSGPLKGKTLAIKDNVCVAGVPMMNGSSVLEGYVPDIDATVVTRILDAGGTILGKAVCENFCFDGGSHTSDTGPVRNPHNPSHMAGGSSSGSAVLVATGEVDMAIGGDQGGSIRMPSGWSGIYGLKPTYGLVPYTGMCSIDQTVDHTGPMARTVRDVALLLEVIAGPDDIDHRQRANQLSEDYTQALSENVRGLRLGIVQEGFGWEGLSEPDVDASVKEAAHAYERLGATVKTVSIPWHRDGGDLLFAIYAEGILMWLAKRHGDELEGTLHHQSAGCLCAWPAHSGKRSARYGEAIHAPGALHAGPLSRALLR